VLLVVAVGWLVLRPTTQHPAGAANSSPPSQPEIADVLQLLQQHADHLLHRDSQGWTSELDDAAAANGYRDRQRAVFDNLAAVPLTSWRYVLSAPVTDPAVPRPGRNPAGRPGAGAARGVAVRAGRGRSGPDRQGSVAYRVHRPAGWRLAGDGDAASDGGPSWQGPWDFGRLSVRAGPHTLVLAHPDHAADAITFQALVEHSVPVVRSVWGTDWNQRVAVLIPDSAAEFSAVAGDLSDSHDLAAVAVADAISSDGTVLGARIVLNPDNLARLDAAGRRLVVQHELTHIAARAQTSDQMPTWLIEGFADYVGNLGSGSRCRSRRANSRPTCGTARCPPRYRPARPSMVPAAGSRRCTSSPGWPAG